jgi:pimeloyl-ACP methyl ester carboxylesterase
MTNAMPTVSIAPLLPLAAHAAPTSLTRFLPVPGGQIAWDLTGDAGPLVVCVPSMGDVRGEYRFLAPRLVAAGYRVATVDVRGMGESSVGFADVSAAAVGSDIVALLRAVLAPGERASIVGTSMAAAAAVWAAAEASDLVDGIALVGPFVRDVPAPWYVRLLLRVMMAWPWGRLAWGSYLPSLYPKHKPADFEAYRAALLRNLAEPGRMVSLRGMMFASKAPCEARIGEVRARALVVMGSRDPDFQDPAAEAKLVAQRLRGEVVMIDGAGHYPHAEVPGEVAPVIVRFLDAGAAAARARNA